MRQLRTTTWLGWMGALFCAFGALAREPYNAAQFQKYQDEGKRILLHFHAPWCPTCKRQEETLTQMERESKLGGIAWMVVDFDKEEDLKRRLKINSQSTLVAFTGAQEGERLIGRSASADITSYLERAFPPAENAKDKSASEAAAKRKHVVENALDELRKSGIQKRALKVGARIPSIRLPDASGQMRSVQDLLKKGPVVLSFYRGGWCPFCNKQLSSYAAHYDEFRKRGAELVAISPETPEQATDTQNKDKIPFVTLSDANNAVAGKFGLVFSVSPEVKRLYLDMGIDLEKSQGNGDWKLPLPATYVVRQDGRIAYAFIDVDYRKRASEDNLWKALDDLKK